MKKILFCHIPKCSGTTINKTFEDLPNDKYNFHWYIHKILLYDLNKYIDYYKFSIIRDPIKKLISLYFYQTNFIEQLSSNIEQLEIYQEGNWNKKYNIIDIYSFLNNYK